jgi:hypothetical protein
MTLREQLLQEIEQAPDSVIEELLSFCRQIKTEQQRAGDALEQPLGTQTMTQRDAVRQLQAKIRETVPEGRSLVDELIAERRMEGSHE